MPATPDLSTWRRDEDFLADPTPVAVLDEDLTFRAVNPAYEKATGFTSPELLSRFVFEVFPPNEAEPDGDEGPRAMEEAMAGTLREGRPKNLVVQRYDIPDAADPCRFVTKVWAPLTVPVRHDGTVVGIACRVPELRLPERALRVIAPLRAALREAAGSEDPTAVRVVDAVAWGLREYAAALTEVDHLHAALASRATIDQAKGLLMAEHHCSPEEAFELLVKLSNDTNVRLAEVASALVYQAQHGAG